MRQQQHCEGANFVSLAFPRNLKSFKKGDAISSNYAEFVITLNVKIFQEKEFKKKLCKINEAISSRYFLSSK